MINLATRTPAFITVNVNNKNGGKTREFVNVNNISRIVPAGSVNKAFYTTTDGEREIHRTGIIENDTLSVLDTIA